jgi:hypothetical protein
MKRIFFPPRTLSKLDTGLRFTDILFGFVIREIFLRLQEWGHLEWYVRCQLIAATVLVLGSWIGFRRSVNRSGFEVKFFNLPFFMFVLDQAMVFFYFRFATRTPSEPSKEAPPGPDTLADTTLDALLIIVALYFVWDLLGVAMTKAKDRMDPARPHKYPAIDQEKKVITDKPRDPEWWGVAITGGALVAAAVLWKYARGEAVDAVEAQVIFIVTAVVLLGYRWAKEIRTTWKAG